MQKAQNRARAEALVAKRLGSSGSDLSTVRADLVREHPGLRKELERVCQDGEQVSTLIERLRPQRVSENDRSAAGSVLRYERRNEVARGGMGVIYEVWDQPLHRLLAMKVNLRGADEATEARFAGEARITAQLDHPGIVPVHDAGRDSQDRGWFTMKLVRGETLSRVFEHGRDGSEGWTRTRALGVLLKVCEALAYAHAKGVVHRDLKPQNVMVGPFGEVYVMDWGLAKVLAQSEQSVSLPPAEGLDDFTLDPLVSRATVDGAVMGTPAYMPPEQAEGRIDLLDRRADVYAVGAMLYELLTGCIPHTQAGRRLSPAAILEAARTGPPGPIREVAGDVPLELEAICEKAMARDPDARYDDIKGLADDLRAFLENRVVSAWRIGPWVEFRKWVARNRALAATVAGALVLLLALASGTSVVLAAKNRAISAANDEARGINEFILEEVLFGLHPERARGREMTVREALEKAVTRIEERDVGPGVEAAVREAIGETFWKLGIYEPAAEQLRQAFELRNELQGPEADLSLNVAERLARVTRTRGDLEGALELIEQTLAIRTRKLGPEHADTLRSDYALAQVSYHDGRFAEAEERYRRNWEARVRVLGEDHENTLNSLAMLAESIEKQGRFEEALPLKRKVLESARLTLGDDHPETLKTMTALASTLQDFEQWEEAEALYQEALDGNVRVLGPDHFEVSTVHNNLATLVETLGRFEEAEEHYLKALEIRRARLSENHPRVAYLWNNLGMLALRLGNTALAEERIGRALEIRSAQLGPDHPDTLDSHYSLARCHMEQRRFDEADAVFVHLIPAATSALGDGHFRLGIYMSWYGSCLAALERFEQAEEELLAGERMVREALGKDHGYTRTVHGQLVELYEAWGRLPEAERWRGNSDPLTRRGS